MFFRSVISSVLVLASLQFFGEEYIIGKAHIEPGIDVVFEAAPKDTIYPIGKFLEEDKTSIHIEALINWSDNAPAGSPIGGFIPYLEVMATIISDSDEVTKTMLVPHINNSDNLHYAQNVILPGNISKPYKIIFEILPPQEGQIGIHYDWNKSIGDYATATKFVYENLNLEKIVSLKRR